MCSVYLEFRSIPVLLGNFPTLHMAMDTGYFNLKYCGAECMTVYRGNDLVSIVRKEY